MAVNLLKIIDIVGRARTSTIGNNVKKLRKKIVITVKLQLRRLVKKLVYCMFHTIYQEIFTQFLKFVPQLLNFNKKKSVVKSSLRKR